MKLRRVNAQSRNLQLRATPRFQMPVVSVPLICARCVCAVG
jgi:hypothetical protein